jgi:protein phosphatase
LRRARAADADAVKLLSSALSDRGLVRKANEDSFAALDERGLYAVADGLGGHVGGRVASEAAMSELVRCLTASGGEPELTRLRRAFRAANRAVRSRAQRNHALRGMATTLAALWLGRDLAALAHVGDSRIYLVRGGRMFPLTLDHSLVAEAVARRGLGLEAARVHPSRSVITRALGVASEVEADTAALRTSPGDLFLLCSDGLTGQVADREIASLLLSLRADLGAAARALVDLANARGGEDNTTVVLVVRD